MLRCHGEDHWKKGIFKRKKKLAPGGPGAGAAITNPNFMVKVATWRLAGMQSRGPGTGCGGMLVANDWQCEEKICFADKFARESNR